MESNRIIDFDGPSSFARELGEWNEGLLSFWGTSKEDRFRLLLHWDFRKL